MLIIAIIKGIAPVRFSNKDTVVLPFGLFFGVERQSNINTMQKQADMKKDLYRLLLKLHDGIKKTAAHPISEKIITKTVNTGKQIRGKVVCIYCKHAKTISVDIFSPKNSCALYWSLANLKAHLKKEHGIYTKKQRDKKNTHPEK